MSPSGYITGRPVVYPAVRLHNRSIAGHPYGTYIYTYHTIDKVYFNILLILVITII